MPTQAEIEQHQQDVEELSILAVAAMATVVLAASEEDDEESTLLAAIPATLEPYMSAAAELATEWYRGLAREEPRPLTRPDARVPAIVGPTSRKAVLDAQEFEPRPAELPPREQIEATVRWAMHQPPPPEPHRETADLDPAEMSQGELRSDVERLRPAVGEPAPQREASTPRPVVSARVTATPAAALPIPAPASAERPAEPEQPTREQEEPPRARVVSAGETSSRASIIPAEATEEQARVISQLAGATQRYVASAARTTISENADREDVRWARHAQPDACAFCRLLATRGPAYLTKGSASVVGTGRVRGTGEKARKKGDEYHDDCGCVPIPVRAGDVYEPPDYVEAWEQQYQEAYAIANGNYKQILAVMRAAEKESGGSRH